MKESDLKRSIRDLCRINGAKVYSFYGGMNLPNGWPDLIVAYKGQIFFLEVKTANGRLSQVQIKLADDLAEAGIDYHVVRSAGEVNKICGFPTLIND